MLQALRKRLLARKHFVPWGASKPFVHPGVPASHDQQQLLLSQAAPAEPPAAEPLPPGIEPLVLWDITEAATATAADGVEQPIEVDAMLTRWLRPHQREGVQFMFDCVCGLRLAGGQGEHVC